MSFNKNIIKFKTSEEFELLEQMNTVQNSIILDLQEKNKLLQEKIQHLESLLFSKAFILDVKNDNT